MTVPPRSFPTHSPAHSPTLRPALRPVLAPALSRTLRAALFLALVLPVLTVLAPAATADVVPTDGRAARSSSGGYICTGYVPCAQGGHPHFGYKRHSSQMWWRMYAGHNCTNYVAYRLVKRGMSAERPWDGTGMAYNWGRANRRITDSTPRVGAVAWWNAGDGVGSSGHVAYVQRVVSRRKIIISEDSWSGDFHWRVVTKSGGRWPTGFVHLKDEEIKAVRAPAVVGTPAVGQPLTADPGEWRPAAATSLQWLADGKPVAGATDTTFTPGPELLKSRLSVRVTATAKGYDAGTATSAPTEPVAPGEMTSTQQPVLSGTARVDEMLTLDPGTTSPAPTSTVVRWYADGTRIDGVTGTRLELGQDLIRRKITAVVTARRDGYRKLQATTPATKPVQAGLIKVTDPYALPGRRARLDRTLTVHPGTIDPTDADVTYAWLRDGEPIAGATGETYTPGIDDVGHRVEVRVVLSHTGYQDLSQTLTPRTLVMTKPKLAVRTVGRRHKAVVRVRVRAPGVADPGGEARVRLGRRSATRGEVVDGVLRVVFRRLPAGDRRIRVHYGGTDVVLPARSHAVVHVGR